MSRLIDTIAEYKEAFKEKVPQEIKEVMFKATKKLQDEKLSKNALKKSDSVKGFSLPNAVGENISLDEILKENDFAVINFYRGVWCPYCNLELKALQDKFEEFKSLGAQLIAISPQTPDASMTTKEKNELEFEVLSDKGNKIAKEFGLVFSLADELKPIYISFGIDIPTNNNEDSYELPMPATYIIDKNKEIVFAYIDEDYTKRCEPQDVVDAIKNYGK